MSIVKSNQKQFNPQNERIKYEYKKHLARLKRADEKTLRATFQHIREFEELMSFKNFSQITSTEVSQYIDKLCCSGTSLSYLSHNVRALNRFFLWLQTEIGYKIKMEPHLADYFSLSNNQRRVANAPNYRESYERAEIEGVINTMPTNTLIDRRNRAIIAIQYLCGLRISELRTLPIKSLKYHKDAQNYFVYVDPKVMDVKFAKTRCAFFMPFGEQYTQIVLGWKKELEMLGFSEKAPLFPTIPTQFNQLNVLELTPKQQFIKSNSTIRAIFKDAFQRQNLRYHCPHTFRHTIARWAETQVPAVFNAVRHSLGHADIKTTFMSYGTLPDAQVGRLLKEAQKEIQ